MKRTITGLVIALCAFSIPSFANTQDEYIQRALEAASKYADSIACGVSEISAGNVAALVPCDGEDRYEAKYAVIWTGDIECYGGSGTTSTNIAMVHIGGGDTFFVKPELSSPLVSLELYSSRSSAKVIDSGSDYIILEGFDYHPSGKDPGCCPSLKIKKVIKPDNKGNWIAQ